MNYIAFDFDGTIVDSTFAICEAMERACIRQGVLYVGDEEFSQCIGRPLNEMIYLAAKEEIDEKKANNVLRSYRETFRDNLVKPYTGMVRLLELCHETGDRIAVASSRNSHSLNSLIMQLSLKEQIDVIVGANDVTNPKPHGATLWEVATRLQCNPREIIMVGDTTWDMEMAKNCGSFAIGVSWGAHDEIDLSDAGADLVCDSPSALGNYFNFATV